MKKYHALETIDFLQLKKILQVNKKNDKPIPPPHPNKKRY